MIEFSERLQASTAGMGALNLARHAAAPGLRAVLALQILRFVLRLVFAGALAILAGSMIEHDTLPIAAAAAGMAALVAAAGAGLIGDWRQAAAEAAVAEAIHADVRGRLEAMPVRALQVRPAGALIAGLQRHPESLAALVVGHRAAAMMLRAGPLLAAISILAVSWQASLVLLVASPVMIVFFVLVGGTIHSRADAQAKAFGQLAAQFEDRVRTLPTILASHGLVHERHKLETRMRAYAQSTMGVLKIAFLNAGIIDFFAALSIAVLAVFLGLGHLKLIEIPGFSNLQLWQSLFILMLAPEFFSPFRRYAEQYHAKAEGDAAAGALDGFFEDADVGKRTASLPILDRYSSEAGFTLPQKGLVAIVGPSGAGKSTLLRRLAGVEGTYSEHPKATGGAGVDWISTDIPVLKGTLADALRWNSPAADQQDLLVAARRIGLLDDRMLPGGLDTEIRAGGDNLSGGQRLRIGVARALLSGRAIMADEPTAKLDAMNADRVRQALFDCAKDRLVVVATHDAALAEGADMVLNLCKQGADLAELDH